MNKGPTRHIECCHCGTTDTGNEAELRNRDWEIRYFQKGRVVFALCDDCQELYETRRADAQRAV